MFVLRAASLDEMCVRVRACVFVFVFVGCVCVRVCVRVRACVLACVCSRIHRLKDIHSAGITLHVATVPAVSNDDDVCRSGHASGVGMILDNDVVRCATWQCICSAVGNGTRAGCRALRRTNYVMWWPFVVPPPSPYEGSAQYFPVESNNDMVSRYTITLSSG